MIKIFAVNLLLVCSLATSFSAFAETESRGQRDASGFKSELIQLSIEKTGEQNDNAYQWSDIEEAFDRASASWMNVYGDGAFKSVRPHVEQGIRAMNALQWVPQGTRVIISMLDARGDFAQVSDGICRAQINVDESGQSPIIVALGSKGSAPAFLIAHELAHCRFDSLSPKERLPTLAMLFQVGVPKSIAARLMAMMENPQENDGSLALLDAYDEALADSAATVALLQFERKKPSLGFATAIDRAQSLRMGLLFMSQRRNTRAEAHQGGFVFDEVVSQSSASDSPNASWELARSAAIKSVLYSNLALKQDPKWWPSVSQEEKKSAWAWRLKTKKKAQSLMAKRNVEADEDLFLTANSPAFMAIIVPDRSDANAWDDPNMHWKQVGWIDPALLTE